MNLIKTAIYQLFSLMILLAVTSLASAQEMQRIVLLPDFQSSTNDKALEIVDIRVAESVIELDQPFIADDDWLSSLSFNVKNVSGKPVRFIRMSFSMLEAKSGDQGLGFSFAYGTPCSLKTDPLCNVKSKELKLVMPDEVVEMKFNGNEYQRNQDFILRKAGITKISRILIGIAMTQFEDGTNALTQNFIIRNTDKTVKGK